ncbi:TPA: phage exclusion protein Lit family protein [Enterobacter roggenkampii]
MPSLETIVLNLLRGAVPENADELCQTWKSYKHTVELAKDAHGSTMNATSRRIEFDSKTIDFFWLFGFSSWLTIETYSPALVKACLEGMTLESALESDEERGQYELNYKQHFHTTKSLLSVANTSDITWPQDIPYPTETRDSLNNAQEQTVFDLVALALSFSILHEYKHVQARAEEKKHENLQEKNEEELACDTWAREYITKGAGDYAKNAGHTYEEVMQKRAMGIALAAFTIHALTPDTDKWGSEEYPSIAMRIQTMIGGYNLSDSSHFWCFTACLLIAVMRQDSRKLDYKASTCKEFVTIILSELH